MKKALFALLALICVFSCVSGITAATGGITVNFCGKFLEFDVPPRIINDRVMVPLRAIFEECGAMVCWDDSTKTVTAMKDDILVILPIGSTKPTVNCEVVELDQPAVIVDGRTLAPLRFVCETFGGIVFWDDESSKVDAYRNIGKRQGLFAGLNT